MRPVGGSGFKKNRGFSSVLFSGFHLPRAIFYFIFLK